MPAAPSYPLEHVRESERGRARGPSGAPTPRVPRLSFERTRRYWFAGSPAATHLSNAVNLLFPAGERFFVRSVRHFQDRLSPELLAQVRGFFGQEGRHAQAHERFFDALRTHGFAIDPLLSRYEDVAYGHIERWSPPALRLAVTVALEHFTALLAEDALDGGGLEGADEDVRHLLEWHAVEELEHKAVAFDVLAEVAPSYALRVAGLALATLTLGGFWLWATRELLKQDGSSLRRAGRELALLRREGARAGDDRGEATILRGVFLRGIREYLRPGFHPSQRDHSGLVERTLVRLAEVGVVPGDALADLS